VPAKAVSEKAYSVSGGTLNSTHSLNALNYNTNLQSATAMPSRQSFRQKAEQLPNVSSKQDKGYGLVNL